VKNKTQKIVPYHSSFNEKKVMSFVDCCIQIIYFRVVTT